jgi:hypothetical protein
MQNKTVIVFILLLIVIVIGIVIVTTYVSSLPAGPDLTAFAQCIKASGATFYGAFWCPHCAATKRMFGAGVEALPYVECSTPDGNSQTPICISKGISSYPTWIFADGSRLSGELTLAQLAQKTNCPLPASAEATETPSTGLSSPAITASSS